MFSPSRIRAAQIYQEEKARTIEQEKIEKAQKKAKAVATRQQRDLEKKERILQRQANRQITQEDKSYVQVQKEVRRKQKKKAIPLVTSESLIVQTVGSTPEVETCLEGRTTGSEHRVTSRGRVITQPQRFQQ